MESKLSVFSIEIYVVFTCLWSFEAFDRSITFFSFASWFKKQADICQEEMPQVGLQRSMRILSTRGSKQPL